MIASKARRLVVGSLAVGLSVLLAACGGGSGASDGSDPTLTLVTFGGTTETGTKVAYADPFTEETGIKTKMVSPVDYGKYAAQIESDKVTWNWVSMEAFFIKAHADWWAPIDRDIVKFDDSDVITIPGYTPIEEDWALQSVSYAFAMAHRTDLDNESHPQTWAEFFDTERFPGKRAVYNYPFGMIEIALLADGVPFEDLYPLDVDRALKKLDTIKDDIVFWNSGAELQQMMSTGETPYAISWNNRMTSLIEDGQPVAIEWNENLQDSSVLVTAKNNPLLKETMQLFAKMQEPQAMADEALLTGYSPALRSAFELIPDDKKPFYNVHEPNLEKAVGAIDNAWWAENFNDTYAKWTAWTGQ